MPKYISKTIVNGKVRYKYPPRKTKRQIERELISKFYVCFLEMLQYNNIIHEDSESNDIYKKKVGCSNCRSIE